MKNPALPALALFLAAETFAQTKAAIAPADTTKITPAATTQMQQLDSCIRHYNHQKAMAKKAMIRGDFKLSNAHFAVADADKKEIKAMAAQLKSEGVSHPMMLAHKEIKRTDKKM